MTPLGPPYTDPPQQCPTTWSNTGDAHGGDVHQCERRQGHPAEHFCECSVLVAFSDGISSVWPGSDFADDAPRPAVGDTYDDGVVVVELRDPRTLRLIEWTS